MPGFLKTLLAPVPPVGTAGGYRGRHTADRPVDAPSLAAHPPRRAGHPAPVPAPVPHQGPVLLIDFDEEQ